MVPDSKYDYSIRYLKYTSNDMLITLRLIHSYISIELYIYVHISVYVHTYISIYVYIKYRKYASNSLGNYVGLYMFPWIFQPQLPCRPGGCRPGAAQVPKRGSGAAQAAASCDGDQGLPPTPNGSWQSGEALKSSLFCRFPKESSLFCRFLEESIQGFMRVMKRIYQKEGFGPALWCSLGSLALVGCWIVPLRRVPQDAP